MRISFFLYIIFVSQLSKSQELLHWKYHLNTKTEGVKKLIVWSHEIENNSATEIKSEFCYQAFDSLGRTTALRMYSADTTFYEYDNSTNWIKMHYGNANRTPTVRTIKYSKSGNIIYDKSTGGNTSEYKYKYNRQDQIKVKINLKDNTEYRYINKKFRGKEISVTLINGKKERETIVFPKDSMNKVTTIYLRYEKSGELVQIPDTTVNYYDHSGRLIKTEQVSHITDRTYVTIFEYYENGLQSLANVDGLVVRFYYNSSGYLSKAERFNQDGTLGFYATFEYEFW